MPSPTDAPTRVVIVGAGHAGFHCASNLRRNGYAGMIALIDADPFPPYEKPCLSKDYLLRSMKPEHIEFRKPSFYMDHGIDLHIGRTVTGIDRTAQTVSLEGGAAIEYSRLVLAPGSRIAPLVASGAHRPEDICYIKTLSDIHVIRERLQSATRVVVIGSGFTALEFAATAAALGKSVRILVRGERVLARVVAPELARYLEAQHESKGVEILHNRAIESIERARDGRLTVRDRTGEAHVADLIVAGVGTVPNVDLAERAGIACDNGIVIDAQGRTSDPLIFAAGDATCSWLAQAGRCVRIESVAQAQGQAKAIAANLLGANVDYNDVPSFWSDQYDTKLQMVGIADGYDTLVFRGNMESDRFTALYYRKERLIALQSVNRPVDQIAGRKLLAAQISPRPADAANEQVSLMELFSAGSRGMAREHSVQSQRRSVA